MKIRVFRGWIWNKVIIDSFSITRIIKIDMLHFYLSLKGAHCWVVERSYLIGDYVICKRSPLTHSVHRASQSGSNRVYWPLRATFRNRIVLLSKGILRTLRDSIILKIMKVWFCTAAAIRIKYQWSNEFDWSDLDSRVWWIIALCKSNVPNYSLLLFSSP